MPIDKRDRETKPRSLTVVLVRRAITPLLPEIQTTAAQLADLIDPPLADPGSVRGAQIRGALAGGIEGLGHVLAGLTSPLGLASLALGGALRPPASPTSLGRLTTIDPQKVLPPEFWPVTPPPPPPEVPASIGGQAGAVDTELLAKLGLGALAASQVPRAVRALKKLSARNPVTVAVERAKRAKP